MSDIIFDNIIADSSDSDSRPSTRSTTSKEALLAGSTGALKKLTLNTNKFMENFNPETSARERRKLTRKLNNTPLPKKCAGALYDENGAHISSGQDLCDCLFARCPGCHFPCPKCNSQKCGLECRVNRKFIYEQADFEGCNITLKNNFGK